MSDATKQKVVVNGQTGGSLEEAGSKLLFPFPGQRYPSQTSEMLTRLPRLGLSFPRLLCNPPARFVSQSKPSGAAGAASVTELHPPELKSGHGEVSPYVKNPDYHGFSLDPVVDEWNMRVGFFFGISVALVIGGAFIHYLPDHGMREWARREAERVILQREQEGVPLLSEYYFDPEKIVLPSSGEQ
ncbi:NADH dehydrogenase [ubiquinone] 1 beta subcomplex subunit 11, mitochondrial [Trematomus bernacchii]|uniref:NADH dehydrogenase [ubiquinone] 1 beta subcomplex subunit 11, mitochondrial n=1 Tax=Trematomus bernacchii TaxID=40690 RepID=UPI00146C8666|nr:NADH dehydrogenase [ubiquinone] 1 beta subcomplex subunit 11, mitochondrial [Trematomus bernacchii]